MSSLPKDEGLDLSSPLRDGSKDSNSSVAEELHKRYHRLVYYFLRIFKLPYEQREDLFNQIFLKIISGLANLKHADNLKSWIVTITKNEIYGFLNKRDRENSIYRTVTRNDGTYSQQENQASADPTPERILYVRQLRDAFDKAVEQLDDSIARPFLMRYRDNMRWRQIAEILDLNEDTARKRSNRARDLIRQYFRRKFGPNSPLL